MAELKKCEKTMAKLVLVLVLCAVNPGKAADWPTFGHDPQRSGWATEEKILNTNSVRDLKLQWETKVNNQSYSLFALTSPVVASGVEINNHVVSVVYVAGIRGSVFALDAETGELLWTRAFRTSVSPKSGGFQGTFLCPNGITATPVIDAENRLLYIIAPDGALYGLDLATGKVRYGPIQLVASFAKSWSLNLVDGIVYTVLSQGCGNGLSGFYAVEVRDRHHPLLRQMLLTNTNTAGIWGRGGPIVGENRRIYGATADGKFDLATGDYSNSVVAVSQKDLSLVDYFLPQNWDYLSKRDFDVASASPVSFRWRNRNLLAAGSKEGMLYLMDADELGGKDHRTPLFTLPKLGNEKNECCDGSGIWGGLSTARDSNGESWLYVPVGGPPSSAGPRFPVLNGQAPHGSIMAFKVAQNAETQQPMLQPVWMSGDFDLPDPVVVANGVVFGLSTGENAVQRGGEERRLMNTHRAELIALDAGTGKKLYSSGTLISSWVHFSGLAVSDGKVFAVDHDSKVYCFGMKSRLKTAGLAQVAASNTLFKIGEAQEPEQKQRIAWLIGASVSTGLIFIVAAAALIVGKN